MVEKCLADMIKKKFLLIVVHITKNNKNKLVIVLLYINDLLMFNNCIKSNSRNSQGKGLKRQKII